MLLPHDARAFGAAAVVDLENLVNQALDPKGKE